MDPLGWRVIQWMGIEDDQLIAGPPMAAGIGPEGATKAGDSDENFDGDKKRPRLHVEKYSPLTKDWWEDELRELITEGGAYGHMAHPFDDKDLTFKDLKNIIERGLGGRLDREDNVTEKLDGQNLMISWKT